ncbi:MAG: damage-control phosphatase ARMT1 family protein [Spirochaetaceae bacterium]|nr:damage-control phosphatase ARMT1 family protein [Spirochaetaceae bacterium]
MPTLIAMHDQKPPYVSMADPGSFARYTLDKRFPEIIANVAALRSGIPRARLDDLARETAEGRISDPFQDPGLPCDSDAFEAEELSAWRGEIAQYAGRLWGDAPFYFAETFLYLKILLAAGYYDSSCEYFREDPYAATKAEELERFLSAPGMEEFFASFAGMRAPCPEDFAAALLFMLKANRIDLSNAKIADLGRRLLLAGGRDDLLVDHTDALAQKIAASQNIHIILDNAGAELAADLVFTWLCLSSGSRRTVVLHAKAAPFFVSDALVKDVLNTAAMLRSLPASRGMGEDLEGFLASGRLLCRDHYFWNGPKHFPDMPESLRAELGGADIVLLKGDANFRRMTEDRRWPVSVNLEELTGWFPADFAILRTFKSEVAADIPGELAARMDKENPGWLTDGRWGCARLVSRTG